MISLEGVLISEALHWVEDGHYIFRSTEFDVIAGATTSQEAIAKFIDKAEDLATYLAELAHDAEAETTHEEGDLAILLLTRFRDAYQAGAKRLENERLRRQILARIRGRRGDSHRAWVRQSPQMSSRQRVVV